MWAWWCASQAPKPRHLKAGYVTSELRATIWQKSSPGVTAQPDDTAPFLPTHFIQTTATEPTERSCLLHPWPPSRLQLKALPEWSHLRGSSGTPQESPRGPRTACLTKREQVREALILTSPQARNMEGGFWLSGHLAVYGKYLVGLFLTNTLKKDKIPVG